MDYKINIYKIINDNDNRIYIGSTKLELKKRLYYHKINKDCKCQILFDLYGFENCKIILLEECIVNNYEQQRIKEQKYINENRDNILNTQNSFTSLEDRKKKEKEWRENNKDLLKSISKKYRENNKERVKENKKKYRENNKERVKELKKLSYLRCKNNKKQE